MGIRETLNRNSRLTTGVAAAVLVLAAGVLAWQFTGSSSTTIDAQGFFSNDDGKTFFTDGLDQVPPFDHDGKQAVRAHIYTCDDGQTTFVGYLERFNEATATKMRAAKADGKLGEMPDSVYTEGSEIKKPGESQWIPKTSPDAHKVTGPSCPPGTTGMIKKIE